MKGGAPGAALLALALAACTTAAPVPTTAPAAARAHATVFVTTELKGYLGPCGCSENMRGGIARTAQVVAQARAAGGEVVLIDTGDALFGTPTLLDDAVPQQERKALAMGEAMKAMGLWVRAPGPLDDVRGPNFRAALALPELPPTGIAQLKLPKGVLAVVEGSTAEQVATRARAARNDGAQFVLGLWRTSLDVAMKERAALTGAVNLALAVKAKDELSGEQNRLVPGEVPLAQTQTKGRSLLKLELVFGGTGEFEFQRGAGEVERELHALDQRIEILRAQVNEPMLAPALLELRKGKLAELVARRETLAETEVSIPQGKNAWSVRFVPLESSFPEEPKVKALVTAYDRDVGLLNVAWAKEHGQSCPKPDKGRAGFVGNGACVDCHEDAFTGWNASKHSHGYETLQHQGKEHHLDCVGCHVTGWQKPGGVCRIDQTQGRQGIGCESCHGPGSLHAEDPDHVAPLKGNTVGACTGCHDRENSPHFDFDRYLKEIITAGHGLPAAKKPRP